MSIRPLAAALSGRCRRRARLCGAFLALFLLSACAGGAGGLHAVKPAAFLEWPVGAQGTKIAWIMAIADAQDLGLGKGIWNRVLELVTGRENSVIERPYGVLHDRAGRLYVADPGRGMVHCMDPGRGRYAVIGGEGTPLRTPIGLAEDDAGRLYISDSAGGMVYRYDPADGSLNPFLAKSLNRPTGIAFNPSNKLIYVADTVNCQIVALDQSGIERRRLGSPGEGPNQFNRPTDIAIDAIGQIYVTDSLNFRITVLSPEGQVVRQFGEAGDGRGYFSRPKGIAVDSAGHVYVSDSLRDGVQVFSPDGSLLLVLGSSGSDKGQFLMPSGLYLDGRDYLFVADTYNKRIQVFRYVAADRETDVNRDMEPAEEAGKPTP